MIRVKVMKTFAKFLVATTLVEVFHDVKTSHIFLMRKFSQVKLVIVDQPPRHEKKHSEDDELPKLLFGPLIIDELSTALLHPGGNCPKSLVEIF